MTADADASHPDAELPSLRAGRYAILRVIAEGRQADTLEAVDKKDGRLVIIKRFRVKGASGWKDVELAEREARVLAGLEHPALPVYVDHFEEDGCLYLAMLKMEGESLATLAARGVRFSESDVIALLHAGAQILEYLQRRQPPLIHRDIKPGNIVWRPDGSFGLVDFGSVRDSLKPDGGSTVVGTFGYMAPEQFQGRALPATDVYGLGATAISLLSGVQPEALPHRGLAIDVTRSLAGLASPSLIRVLTWMVGPDPDHRSAPLSQMLAGLPRPVFHPSHLPGAPAPRPRHSAAPASTSSYVPRAQPAQRPRAPAEPTSANADFDVDSVVPFPADVLLGNPLIVIAALLGLFAARVATWLLFECILTTLFTLLSIFISPLGELATELSRLGRRGRTGLRQAAEVVRERANSVNARRRRKQRLRVERHFGRRQRVSVEADYRERHTSEYDDEFDEGRRRRRHKR